MTARPESAALEPLLEQLGLRQAATVLPDWLDRAASQELSYADFLHGLTRRGERRASQRRYSETAAPGRLSVCRHYRAVRLPLPSGAQASGRAALPGPHVRRASSDAGTDRATRPGQDDAGDLYRCQAHSAWGHGSVYHRSAVGQSTRPRADQCRTTAGPAAA